MPDTSPTVQRGWYGSFDLTARRSFSFFTEESLRFADLDHNGHVEWDDVFAALSDVGYDGWLTIESFGAKIEAIAAAAAIWRDIEAVTESIAFDGVKFLKRKTAVAAAG